MKAIILAGGGGTRLWPLSREACPKQFIKFKHNLSLLQQTILRCKKIKAIQDIFVITHPGIAGQVERQLFEINQPTQARIIQEPVARNTAPAIALTAAFLEKIHGCAPDDVMLFLPADHFIEESPALYQQFEEAQYWAQQGYIVTFGIVPTQPETGYGYIKTLAKNKQETALKVDRFVEKPDLQTAQHYLESGEYYWNSGMFAVSIQTLMNELKAYAPQIHTLLQGDYETVLSQFTQMPSISFDNAIMEFTTQARMIPLAAQWSDVGSWDSVLDVLERNENYNVTVGETIEVNTQRSLIMSHGNRTIATIGLEDVLIIDTEDAILIAKKGESQQVREVVDRFKQKNREARPHSSLNEEPPTWGKIMVLNQENELVVQKIVIHPFQSLTLNIDAFLTRSWTIVSGQGTLSSIDEQQPRILLQGETFTVPPYGECLIQTQELPITLVETVLGYDQAGWFTAQQQKATVLAE